MMRLGKNKGVRVQFMANDSSITKNNKSQPKVILDKHTGKMVVIVPEQRVCKITPFERNKLHNASSIQKMSQVKRIIVRKIPISEDKDSSAGKKNIALVGSNLDNNHTNKTETACIKDILQLQSEAINKDHSYLKENYLPMSEDFEPEVQQQVTKDTELLPQNDIMETMVLDPNEKPVTELLPQNDMMKTMVLDPNEKPVRQYYRGGRSYSKPVCDIHEDLELFEHDELPKPGDKFQSKNSFLEYANARGKKWMFILLTANTYYKEKDCTLTFRCCFCKFSTQKGYKAKGLRKRNKYKTNCPCAVMLRKRNDDVCYTVTHVCYHHDHEVSPEMFAKLPARYRLNFRCKDYRDEILDLYSLDVDRLTIVKYMNAKIGFKAASMVKTCINTMKRDGQGPRMFSAEKLKPLLEKIKEIKEKYGGKVKRNVSSKKEQPNIEVPPSMEYEELMKIGENKETREHEEIIKSKKPKRIRNRKKRTKAPEENEDCNKKSRLETSLDKMAYDAEVLQMIRGLQQSVDVDSENINLWATSQLNGTPNSEDFSYPNKVYATTDNYDTHIDTNQYHEEVHIDTSDMDYDQQNVVINDENVLGSTNHEVEVGYQDTEFHSHNNEHLIRSSKTNALYNKTDIKLPENAIQNKYTNDQENEIGTNVQTSRYRILSDISQNRIGEHTNLTSFLQSDPDDPRVHIIQANNSHDLKNENQRDTHYIPDNYFGKSLNTIIKRRNDAVSNTPQNIRDQIEEFCNNTLMEVSNKTYTDKDTQVDMLELDMESARRLESEIKRIKEMQNRTSRACSSAKNEEIINRHNIDSYIVQSQVSEFIEKLSAAIKISVMEILKNIYTEQAVIRVTKCNSSKRLMLYYTPIMQPDPSPRFTGVNDLQKYKKLCSSYTNKCFYLTNVVQSMQQEIEKYKKMLDY